MRNIHWQAVEGYQNLIQCAVELGLERALGTVFYVSGTISDEGHDIFARTHYMGEHLLNTAMGYEGKARSLFMEWKNKHIGFVSLLDEMRNYILGNRRTHQDLMEGIIWYRRCDYYVQTIYWLSDEVLQTARQKLQTDVATCNKFIVTNCVIVIFTFSVLIPLVLQMSRKTSNTLTGYTRVMKRKTLEVEQEKKKTESILNRMLPTAVSQK